jgi:hypothetical protein
LQGLRADLRGGIVPLFLRDGGLVLRGMRKKNSHWGLDWRTAGACKSLKLQVFLIGDVDGGPVEMLLCPIAKRYPSA